MRSIEGTPRSTERVDGRPRLPPGSERGTRPPCPRAWQPPVAAAREPRSEKPSRGSERSRSATKSSRIIASAFLYRAAATLLPRRPVSRKSPLVVRRLLAVEEDEDDRRAKLLRLDALRELDDERRAARAVVRADEAGQVLRVVVRTDDDRPRGIAAGHEADDVAQARRARPGTDPLGSSALSCVASFLEAGEPAGRGPRRTWRTSRDQAASSSTRSTVGVGAVATSTSAASAATGPAAPIT